MDKQVGWEMVTDSRHDSKCFRAFIDFMFEKFPEQMKVMSDAWMETIDGQLAYEEYVASFEAEKAQCRADHLRDLREDR